MSLFSTVMQEDGYTELLVCPECHESVNMNIFKSIDRIAIAGFTIFKYRYQYFTLCPKCFSSFDVDHKAAKKAEGWTKDNSEICENKLTLSTKKFDLKVD